MTTRFRAGFYAAISLAVCAIAATAASTPPREATSHSSRTAASASAAPDAAPVSLHDSEVDARVDLSYGTPVMVLADGTRTQRIEIPLQIGAARRLYRDGTRLVFVGEVEGAAGAASGVAIFDLATRRFVDAFYGYRVTPSPDGRLIAFVRFYPLHFTAGTEDQVFVYALTDPGCPVRNRAREIDPQSAFDIAGCQVRVDAAQRREAPNVGVDPQQAHVLASRLAWSIDGRTLVFVDRVGNTLKLIAANVSPAPLSVRAFPVLDQVGEARELEIDEIAAARPVLYDVTRRPDAGRLQHRLLLGDPVSVAQ